MSSGAEPGVIDAHAAALSRLPHGPSFRFLSRLVRLAPGADGTGEWDITGGEPFLADHFPGEPIVPGVLLIEAMAQLSGLVAFASGPASHPNRPARLAHADVKILRAVAPPATIRLHARLVREFGPLLMFEVSAHHEASPAAKGALTLATEAA